MIVYAQQLDNAYFAFIKGKIVIASDRRKRGNLIREEYILSFLKDYFDLSGLAMTHKKLPNC